MFKNFKKSKNHLDMEIVTFGQLVNGGKNDLFATGAGHGGGGVVGVATGSVPVARNGLGVKGHDDAEIFSHSPQ